MEWLLTAWLITDPGITIHQRAQSFVSQEDCELYWREVVKPQADSLVGQLVPTTISTYRITGHDHACTRSN